MSKSERQSIGHELAIEVARLADESEFTEEQQAIVDFGDTATIAYKDKPWGLIGVMFISSYMKVHGELIRANNSEENPEIAIILVESRYRSVIATGDILCDWEWYEVHEDGTVETSISQGELTNARHISEGLFAEEEEDVTTTILGLDRPLTETPSQKLTNKRLGLLGNLLEANTTANDEQAEPLAQEIERLEDSGEKAAHRKFIVSNEALRRLLARLKLLGTEDKLGQIGVVSIVDEWDEETSIDCVW